MILAVLLETDNWGKWKKVEGTVNSKKVIKTKTAISERKNKNSREAK